jgi:hypothetical protein
VFNHLYDLTDRANQAQTSHIDLSKHGQSSSLSARGVEIVEAWDGLFGGKSEVNLHCNLCEVREVLFVDRTMPIAPTVLRTIKQAH